MTRHHILCFSRAALPADWLPETGHLALPWPRLLDTLAPQCTTLWLPRDRAEHDIRWKQPIPYVLIEDRTGHLALYQRQGSEARLHGLWSLGVGGHVERIDERPGLGDTLLACAWREVEEELGEPPRELRFLGLINEEKSTVGQVHWGLVFHARIDGSPRHSPELGPVHWHEPDSIGQPLELWSRLALQLYRKLAVSPGATGPPLTSVREEGP